MMSNSADAYICYGVILKDYPDNDGVIDGTSYRLVMGGGECFSEWILAIKRTVIMGDWGGAQDFDPKTLTVADQEKQKLVEFCDESDIERHGESGDPNWLLVVNWG